MVLWFTVHDCVVSWFTVRSLLRMIYGLMVSGLRFVVYGLWFMILWFMDHGLRFIVYGVRFMVYGLWFTVHGLWFRVHRDLQETSLFSGDPWPRNTLENGFVKLQCTTRWTTRVSFLLKWAWYVNKFCTSEGLQLIVWCKLTFDERVAVHRVGCADPA